jgi:peptide/nickel transport system substrate-binding protein
MILHKLSGAVAILVVVSIILAGCAPAQNTQEASSITITIPEDPPSFNAIVGDTGYDALVSNMVMLGLTGIDPEGNIYPELAAELPTIENGGVVVDESAGTMDVTWKLRQDVEWSDGTPVTAEDVVFTWNAIMDPEKGIWVRGSDYVDSVEKIDDHTAVFHYNTLYTGYLTQLGGEQLVVWPAHYCDPEQGYSEWDCGRQPISNGPYVLKEWQVGDHMTFEKNPNYYEAGKPAIDEIVVKIVPDDLVRKELLLKGDSDLVMWATETIAKALEGQPNVAVSMSPTNRWVLRIFMNQAERGTTDPAASPNPFFADVRVRQAVRQAIDVDSIANSVFYGFSNPAWTEFHRQPYKCDVPRPKYDPEAAKALLEEAGWKDTDNDGVRECRGCLHADEGDLLEFELTTYSDYGEAMLLAQQLIGEQLAEIGMKPSLVVIEGNVMWAEAEAGGTEQSGNFDMDLWDDGYSGVDPTDYMDEIYNSSAAVPGSGWNIVRWISPEMDELLAQMHTLDESKRKEVFCQMAELMNEEVPVALLFTVINADAHSSRLQGIQSNGNDVVTWNVADWSLK